MDRGTHSRDESQRFNILKLDVAGAHHPPKRCQIIMNNKNLHVWHAISSLIIVFGCHFLYLIYHFHFFRRPQNTRLGCHTLNNVFLASDSNKRNSADDTHSHIFARHSVTFNLIFCNFSHFPSCFVIFLYIFFPIAKHVNFSPSCSRHNRE